MNPADKRFAKKYQPIADVIVRADIDQDDREAIASAMTDALRGQPDFRPAAFRLLASDPLCACAGYEDACARIVADRGRALSSEERAVS